MQFKAPPDLSPEERAFFATKQRWYQWCTLALGLRRDREQYDAISADLTLFKEVVLELQSTPPLGITLDLFQLWRQGPQFAPRPLTDADQPFARYYMRLQNDVYYRLVRSDGFQQLRKRWLALPNSPKKETTHTRHRRGIALLPNLSLQDRALVYLTCQLFQPLKPLLIDSFRPHPLPAFTAEAPPAWLHTPLDLVEQLEETLQQPGWLSLHLDAMLQSWTRLRDSQWLPTSAQHILTHFALLPSKLHRIRWQQIAAIDEAIEPCDDLQHYFALRDHGYRESRIPTRSSSPEGGYHGICRKGPMENMLHSELLYWDESLGEDQFELRWIEGELLFYEREQSRSFTWQRQLVISLDLDPGEIRYKHPSHPAAGHTLLFGFLARLFQDLRQICPEELLRFSLRLGPTKAWSDDAPLLQLYFSHLPQIGASTTLELHPQPHQWLQQEPPKIGELRLLIMSASRWQALLQDAQPMPHHLSLVWTTDPNAIQHNAHDETSQTDKEPFSQTERNAHKQIRHLKRTIGPHPDEAFFLNASDDPIPPLTQLRKDVLESILKTSLVPKT